jgi:hypothetical protein
MADDPNLFDLGDAHEWLDPSPNDGLTLAEVMAQRTATAYERLDQYLAEKRAARSDRLSEYVAAKRQSPLFGAEWEAYLLKRRQARNVPRTGNTE